jgi:hypothetical protein
MHLTIDSIRVKNEYFTTPLQFSRGSAGYPIIPGFPVLAFILGVTDL